MSLSESEFYEAGMSLPPDVRKHVALRLLESLESADQESIDVAWTSEIALRVDDIRRGTVKTVPGEQVFAEIAAKTASRDT
ncbi:addiction module protein [Nocardioides humilatus]|uniref:Addiction module protein n=1 Tax=Nocardioides humilatus TaxID=2607660 RepID=A0A5B1LM56_9ACTN|nr:addiction module protein [Nocardioides humilatus]KAA1421762.1 addiction module protein [Nocardioides humilatus]